MILPFEKACKNTHFFHTKHYTGKKNNNVISSRVSPVYFSIISSDKPSVWLFPFLKIVN